jgi:hypothetical protein
MNRLELQETDNLFFVPHENGDVFCFDKQAFTICLYKIRLEWLEINVDKKYEAMARSRNLK